MAASYVPPDFLPNRADTDRLHIFEMLYEWLSSEMGSRLSTPHEMIVRLAQEMESAGYTIELVQ